MSSMLPDLYPHLDITDVVPITTSTVGFRRLVETHLLSLTDDDRYMRFYTSTTDDGIRRYIDRIMSRGPDDSAMFAVFNADGSQIVGLCEVGVSGVGDTRTAELALSVDTNYRRKDIGIKMLNRAILHCKSVGITKAFMYCLSKNQPMQRMARKLNMEVVTEFSESTGELVLPDESTHRAMMQASMADAFALYDLRYRKSLNMWKSLLTYGHDLLDDIEYKQK